MTKKQLKKEFLENRTSWKYFEKHMPPNGLWTNRLLLEILKELQYMNDKT